MSAITDDAQINAEIRRDLGSDGDLDALLSQLTVEQVRFVIARQDCGSDREAARAVGVSESAVYRWPPVVKRAVNLMAQDSLVTALHLRHRHLVKAMAVKVRDLDSRDERIRQGVATEIIEWELGRATQRTQVTANTVLSAPETVLEGERLLAEFRKGGETRGGRCAPAMARSCAHGNDSALHVGDIRTPSSSSEGGQ